MRIETSDIEVQFLNNKIKDHVGGRVLDSPPSLKLSYKKIDQYINIIKKKRTY
jgi:hypothetical protein